ncbi:MAG: NGG1p interacting factor NIF3 [Candidatus Omnitrophica bacterium]|nr:NGG1p interacting factor NIF3 [Candidatus Omnitrophota bacterium]
MKIKELYEMIVKKGIEFDPRGQDIVKRQLEKAQKSYKELGEKEKKEFDTETLTNPYPDTRILNGDPDKAVKNILLGIDMEMGELLLADRLNEKGGRKIDLVMAHHPEGRALAGLYQVMHVQTDILNKIGVSINVAEGLMGERISEVERALLPANHRRSVDVARLLDMPFMCCHTPSDNCVMTYLTKLMEEKRPDTVGDVMDILKDIPEYKEAIKEKTGPRAIKGDKNSTAGKVFVDMTGGTEGSKQIFEKLSQAGVGTLVCMHLSEQHFEKAKKEHINIIIAGHISSDTLGLNLLLDEIEKKAKLNIIACSGFKRIERRGR